MGRRSAAALRGAIAVAAIGVNICWSAHADVKHDQSTPARVYANFLSREANDPGKIRDRAAAMTTNISFTPVAQHQWRLWYLDNGAPVSYDNFKYDADLGWLLFEEFTGQSAAGNATSESVERLNQYDCATQEMRSVNIATTDAQGVRTEDAPVDQLASELVQREFAPFIPQDPDERKATPLETVKAAGNLDALCKQYRATAKPPERAPVVARGFLSPNEDRIAAAVAKFTGPADIAAAAEQELRTLDAQGDGRAAYELAVALIAKNGADNDSADLLESAAQHGDIPARYLYRERFKAGTLLTAGNAGSFVAKRRERAAGAAPGWASISLGLAAEFGVPGVARDLFEARRLYQAVQNGPLRSAANENLALLALSTRDVAGYDEFDDYKKYTEWQDWIKGKPWLALVTAAETATPWTLYFNAIDQDRSVVGDVHVSDIAAMKRSATMGYPPAIALLARDLCRWTQTGIDEACTVYSAAASLTHQSDVPLFKEILSGIESQRNVDALCAQQEKALRAEPDSPVGRDNLNMCLWKAAYVPAPDMLAYLYDATPLTDGFGGRRYLRHYPLQRDNYELIARMEKVTPGQYGLTQVQRVMDYANIARFTNPRSLPYDLSWLFFHPDCQDLDRNFNNRKTNSKTAEDRLQVQSLASQLIGCYRNYLDKFRTEAKSSGTYALLTPREKSINDQLHDALYKNVESRTLTYIGKIEAAAIDARDYEIREAERKAWQRKLAAEEAARDAEYARETAEIEAEERAQARRDAKERARQLAAQPSLLAIFGAAMQQANRQIAAMTPPKPRQLTAEERNDFYLRTLDAKADTNSDVNRTARADKERYDAQREKQETARRDQESRRRNAQLAAAAAAADAKDNSAREAQAKRDEAKRRDAELKHSQDEAARRLAAERERVKAEEERRAREEAARRERDRLAAEESAKRAREAEERRVLQAKRDFLDSLQNRIKLVATTCMGGEGKYYVNGIMPQVTQEVVSCVDVHFRAYCSGSNVGISGVMHSFVGMSNGCFAGDAVPISPTPSCAVGQVNVRVEKVVHCNE